MERDLDVKPGLKIAGCVVLIIAILVLVGPFLGYVVALNYELHKIKTHKVGIATFYGMVEDPGGTPIPEVGISAELSGYRLLGGDYDIDLRTTTDENGRFSFGPRKGIEITINGFEKAGYEVRGRRWPKDGWQYWRFLFTPTSRDRHVPNSDEPFVFTLETKSGP